VTVRRSGNLQGRRVRAEDRRLRREGVRAELAVLLAVYACRDGMSPHERNQRRVAKQYTRERLRVWRERRAAGST
jgi:hypothetical protein